MAYIIFEFNNQRFRLERPDSEVEKLFVWYTGIKIEKKKTSETKKQIEEINKETIYGEELKELKHPSVEDLVNLFKTQTNFEFGTELIREKFYPDLDKNQWRKAYYSIYNKIISATKMIEEQEKGHFIKQKQGKFTYYKFIKDNIRSLSEYQTNE